MVEIKQELANYIKNIKPILNTLLDEQIVEAGEIGDFQRQMVEHFKVLVTAGKGIRGYLTCLGYEIGGGTDFERVLRTSTYMEVFHTSILIQDDYMDRDDFRRGIESAHSLFSKNIVAGQVKIPPQHFGASTAICLGDFGLYLAWKILVESGFEAQDILEASKIHSNLTMRLGLGQSLDISIPANTQAKEEDILKVIWIKSGEYTCLLPLKVGLALSGNQNKQLEKQIEEYAKCLGWAFQIQDDILSMFGSSEKTGKPVGNDIREGKNTLLTLHLQNNGTDGQKKLLEECLGNENLSTEKFEELKQAFIDCGSLENVSKRGWDYVEQGKKAVDTAKLPTETKEKMKALLAFMMERVK